MKLHVLIHGYGEMGHAMEFLLSGRHDVSVVERGKVLKGPAATPEQALAAAQVVLFCLPVNPHHEIASNIAPLLQGNALCLSIAKGLDDSGRTAAGVFEQVFGPTGQPYGVIYGPMISEELRAGRHGFADVVLSQGADYSVIQSLFHASKLVCRQAGDMHGRSWSVILKNVYAILFGIADAMQLGDNMRGHLAVAATTELSGIVQELGGHLQTPYGYAGLGDLITTATSPGSHHHTLGEQLVRGAWSDISGEGVHTLQMVEKYRLFGWRSYPLFALVYDVIRAPENLHELVGAYLAQLREQDSCAL